MVGWHHRCNGHELGQTSGDGGTGRPGVLQFMGLQRVRSDWATEKQQHITIFEVSFLQIAYNQVIFHNADLCLLINAFGTFTSNVTKNTLGLKIVILFFVFCLVCLCLVFSVFLILSFCGLLKHVLEFHFNLSIVLLNVYFYTTF